MFFEYVCNFWEGVFMRRVCGLRNMHKLIDFYTKKLENRFYKYEFRIKYNGNCNRGEQL